MNAERAARDLAARWCDAVARADVDAWADCWRRDGTWQLAGQPRIVGIDALRRVFETKRAAFELCVPELLSGWVVEADKRTAGARWYVRELQRPWAGTGHELIGCYDDCVVRGDKGCWQFARRRFWLLYRAPRLLTGDVFRPPPPAGT